MGVVYQARQVSLNRPVALKMIKAGVLADEVDLRRFQNEAEAVALLDHPGIVPVYEVGDHNGQRYFSMKLVEGGNLADCLDDFQDNPRAAAALMVEVAEAVQHAHMRGILHRDLKPANILVDAEGRPHVTDFGLARRVEDDAGMTLSGAILGTPSYMAPEQAAGRRRGSITTATDIYGLGAVLYALLANRPPFPGESVVDTLTMVRERPPEPPGKFNRRVPRDLETICLKCLEKDPRRRYGSAQAVADDLRRWLENRAISARPVGAIERLGLWARRRPAVAALAAAVVAAAVGGVAAVIAVQERANRRLSAKNSELAAEKARVEVEKSRVQQRFELAQEAIRTFHSGVSEDVLLKEPQFENLRTRLLGGASEFYGKLESLLRGQTDRASRAALGRAYDELGGLTDQIGNKAKALEVRRKALAVRRALAEGTGPVDPAKLDVARDLVAVGWLNYELHHYEEFAAQAEEAASLADGLRPGRRSAAGPRRRSRSRTGPRATRHLHRPGRVGQGPRPSREGDRLAPTGPRRRAGRPRDAGPHGGMPDGKRRRLCDHLPPANRGPRSLQSECRSLRPDGRRRSRLGNRPGQARARVRIEGKVLVVRLGPNGGGEGRPRTGPRHPATARRCLPHQHLLPAFSRAGRRWCSDMS